MMATKAQRLKTPTPKNRAALNTSGKSHVNPVSATPATPQAPQMTGTAQFSDEGAAVSQVHSTAQPDMGFDDTPLANADGAGSTYTYVSTAPLFAVQSAKQS